MYGDVDPEETQDMKKEAAERRAIIRQEARAIADTNEAIHAKVPAINDAPAQVRIAIYGIDIPGPEASIKEKIRYCQAIVSRIPAVSKDEAWEIKRTFADILDRSRSQGREDIVHERLDSFILRVNLLISTADPKATQGLTGIAALITQDRRETLNQTIRQQPLSINSPGIVESLRNIVSGGRP